MTPTPLNVVLTLECLPIHWPGAYGNTSRDTTGLDFLTLNSTVFNRAYAVTCDTAETLRQLADSQLAKAFPGTKTFFTDRIDAAFTPPAWFNETETLDAATFFSANLEMDADELLWCHFQHWTLEDLNSWLARYTPLAVLSVSGLPAVVEEPETEEPETEESENEELETEEPNIEESDEEGLDDTEELDLEESDEETLDAEESDAEESTPEDDETSASNILPCPVVLPPLHHTEIQLPWWIRFPDENLAATRFNGLVTPADFAAMWLAGTPDVVRRDEVRTRDGSRWSLVTDDWFLTCVQTDDGTDSQTAELYSKPDDWWEQNNVASLYPDLIDEWTRNFKTSS